MRTLVLGAPGFIGRQLSAYLTNTGQAVWGLGRSHRAAAGLAATYICGDRRCPDEVLDIVRSKGIECVVDLVAMTEQETQPLIQRLDGAVHQYVMISSCDVYRNYELLHRLAEGPATAGWLNEDAPLRVTRYPYQGSNNSPDPARRFDIDTYDKIPIEHAVRELTLDWTILRLPMVFGPGDRLHRFRWAVAHMATSREPLVMPSAWAYWVSTYGYVENVAAAVASTVGNTIAARKTFNVGELEPADNLNWARGLADVMEWPGSIEVTSDPGHPLARKLHATGLDLSVPLAVDSRRFRTETGFRDPVPMRSALQQTVAAELDAAETGMV